MKNNDKQLGRAEVIFTGTTAVISGLTAVVGMIAFDTTLNKMVIYNGSRWMIATERTNIVQDFFIKTLVDNVATSVFRIETTNESGNNDGGYYSVTIEAVIGHAAGSAASAGAGWTKIWKFSRLMSNLGAGINSVVSTYWDSLSLANNSPVRDILDITATLVETSEYQLDFQITANATGSSAGNPDVTLIVNIIWIGFLHAPVLSQL